MSSKGVRDSASTLITSISRSHAAQSAIAAGLLAALPTSALLRHAGTRPRVYWGVTAALASHECDVADISQRNVGGYFHTVFTCAVPPGRDFGSVKDSLQCLGGEGDYVVRVMHESVFRFMHRV